LKSWTRDTPKIKPYQPKGEVTTGDIVWGVIFSILIAGFFAIALYTHIIIAVLVAVALILCINVLIFLFACVDGVLGISDRHNEVVNTIRSADRYKDSTTYDFGEHFHITDGRQVTNNYLTINTDEPDWEEISKTPKRGRPKRS